jgi:5-formyltetrahydrofolate cyclo-ligase
VSKGREKIYRLLTTEAKVKRVFLPRIVDVKHKQFESQNNELEMIEVLSISEIQNFQPHGKYKLREPPIPCSTDKQQLAFDAGGLDLIILPGMAFTSKCERLGHGKGFYDTFISRHSEWSKANNKRIPFLIAIGCTAQLVDSIPTEPHDKALDAVIINDTLYRNNQ